MLETPLFFDNNNYRLFGVFHAPNSQSPQVSKKLAMVFCTPFAEEKMIAHRVFVNMARTLASEGIACLRFDFMGEGDSEGNFEDSTIKTRLSDIRSALSVLNQKAGVKKMGLIGVRFGATLAALAASQNSVESLVLISPIVFGKPYMEQCLLSNLSTQLVVFKKVLKDRKQLVNDLMAGEMVNIDGYLMNRDLYEETCQISLLNSIPTVQNTLIVDVVKNEKQPTDEALKELYEICGKSHRTEFRRVQDCIFWKDSKLYSALAPELNKTLISWLSNATVNGENNQ